MAVLQRRLNGHQRSSLWRLRPDRKREERAILINVSNNLDALFPQNSPGQQKTSPSYAAEEDKALPSGDPTRTSPEAGVSQGVLPFSFQQVCAYYPSFHDQIRWQKVTVWGRVDVTWEQRATHQRNKGHDVPPNRTHSNGVWRRQKKTKKCLGD